jgi:hypothetical protein
MSPLFKRLLFSVPLSFTVAGLLAVYGATHGMIVLLMISLVLFSPTMFTILPFVLENAYHEKLSKIWIICFAVGIIGLLLGFFLPQESYLPEKNINVLGFLILCSVTVGFTGLLQIFWILLLKLFCTRQTHQVNKTRDQNAGTGGATD